MQADRIFANVHRFVARLRTLKALRRRQVTSRPDRHVRRPSLTKADRAEILSETAGRCHICGGTINSNDWQADHVLAHSTGGRHAVDNFLPAHTICNNYRWYYDAEEFQWILKLGVWLRTQIEYETATGLNAGQKFCDYDRRRAARRKKA